MPGENMLQSEAFWVALGAVAGVLGAGAELDPREARYAGERELLRVRALPAEPHDARVPEAPHQRGGRRVPAGSMVCLGSTGRSEPWYREPFDGEPCLR